jgi:hypothetical protein
MHLAQPCDLPHPLKLIDSNQFHAFGMLTNYFSWCKYYVHLLVRRDVLRDGSSFLNDPMARSHWTNEHSLTVLPGSNFCALVICLCIMCSLWLPLEKHIVSFSSDTTGASMRVNNRYIHAQPTVLQQLACYPNEYY